MITDLNVEHETDTTNSAKEPILGYLEVLNSKIESVAVNVPYLTSDPELASWKDTIVAQIETGKGEISTNNNIVSSLPTVKPVDPPSGFEAFCRNTSEFLDATLGTIVDVVADGLSTVIEGVGKGIGNIFNLSTVIPVVLCALVGFSIYKGVMATKHKYETEGSNSRTSNYQNNKEG